MVPSGATVHGAFPPFPPTKTITTIHSYRTRNPITFDEFTARRRLKRYRRTKQQRQDLRWCLLRFPVLSGFPFFFWLFFFGWGKGGKCAMHRSARRHRVWDSSTACHCQWVFSPVGQICRLTYPLKPSYAGEPGHIPSREVGGWTCLMIEIGGSELALSIQSPTAFYAFYETLRVPAFSLPRSFSTSLVSIAATS